MSQVGAEMAEIMVLTPTGKYSKQWPDPQRFAQLLDKMGKMMSEDYDWSSDIAKLRMPVLLLFADNDSVSQKHVAEFFALLGGGVKEPGWLNTQLSKSRLAVVPGYSHYNFISSAGATDYRQVPGRSAHQSAERSSRRLADRAGQVAVDLDHRPERTWSSLAPQVKVRLLGCVPRSASDTERTPTSLTIRSLVGLSANRKLTFPQGRGVLQLPGGP